MVVISNNHNHPDPARWAVETFGLEKLFTMRQGLPIGMGWGPGHFLTSALVKLRRPPRVFKAIQGVDLKVARGEMLALLGPNGAGKTTLIKCLATLLHIDGGAAYVNGFNVATQPDQARLSMNLVGSGHWVAFDWAMTLTQNLHFFGSLYGLTRAERRQRIEYTLEVLGLTSLAQRNPNSLSSGERQRMLLAKGFMVRTPVFLLDEPTVGLDPTGARAVREFIRKDLLDGALSSGILTTHRLEEAESLCHRIAIIDVGRIVADGTALELKRLAGQQAVLEIIARDIPRGADQALKGLPGVRAAATAPVGSQGVEESLRVHCEEAEATQGPIIDWLRRHGAEVLAVELQEPTLEDAFLTLTHRRLQ